MAEIKYTPEQREAIEDRGNNLLVSASAGSGKTMVMVKRIAALMLEQNIDITNFLVVTFTKASAQDMKLKLEKELLEAGQSEFVLSQLDKIAVSDVSDLHSFCFKLIETYFYVTELDPSVKILDQVQAETLKQQVLSKLFESKEKCADKSFFAIYDIFSENRTDLGLRNAILKLNNFLNSHLDGEAWFAGMLDDCYSENLSQNRCANEIKNSVLGRTKKLVKIAEKFLKKCEEFDCKNMAEHFFDIAQKLKVILKFNNFSDIARAVFETDLGRSPTVKGDLKFLSEEAKEVKKIIKSELDNFKENLTSEDENKIVQNLILGRQTVNDLFNLTMEFNQKFEQAKRDINTLDFNDLEKYALKILSNPEVLLAVKAKYKFVFVDEYQDINEVQERILSLVSGEDNRFMVGDVKQSIYRFRLCDPEIFLQKFSGYLSGQAKSKVIKLNANFRSDKKILSFVDRVFSDVMTKDFGEIDYKSEARFQAGENNLDEPGAMNLCYIDTTKPKSSGDERSGIYSVKNHEETNSEETLSIIAEANLVAQKIAELVNPLNKDHLNFSDIAVLVFARNELTRRFINILTNFSIPVTSDEKYDLFEQASVFEILNLIKLCYYENDDILLFKVLKSRFFTFLDEELVKIKASCGRSSLSDALWEYLQSNEDELSKKIKHFLEELKQVKSTIITMSISEAVKFVLTKFKIVEQNLLLEQGERMNEDLNKLLSILPHCSVQEFVFNYDGFKLEMEGECGGDSVSVMTVHKSKGLEFKAVFLINLCSKINFTSLSENLLVSKNFGVGTFAFDIKLRTKSVTLPLSAIKISEKRKISEEQQRVLYVALTRAKEKLFVICSKPEERLLNSFPERPTNYINWFESIISSELSGKCDKNIVFENYKIADLLGSVEEEQKELLLESVEVAHKEFVYNYSTSIDIPLKNSVSKILKSNADFIEEDERERERFFDDEAGENYNDLSAKKLQNSSLNRGTIYHKFFEKIDFSLCRSAEEMVDFALQKLSEEDAKIISRENMIKTLSLPFFSSITSDSKVLKEKEFFAYVPANLALKNALDGEKIMLQGIIDLLVFEGDKMFLLDYKTGSWSQEKIEKYSFQLNAYGEVCERIFNKKCEKKFLCFVDSQKMIEI